MKSSDVCIEICSGITFFDKRTRGRWRTREKAAGKTSEARKEIYSSLKRHYFSIRFDYFRCIYSRAHLGRVGKARILSSLASR